MAPMIVILFPIRGKITVTRPTSALLDVDSKISICESSLFRPFLPAAFGTLGWTGAG